MNRQLPTFLVATTCMLSVPSLAHADRVEHELDAKVTNTHGIFTGLEGETVQVRIVYDVDMLEEFPVPPTCSPRSGDTPGDANGDGMISATDPLAILRTVVGQPVALNCPAC